MLLKRDFKRFFVFTLAFIFDQYQKISIKNYYRAFYFPGAYQKRESLHKMVYRMTKIKEIEKEVKNGEVYIKLTSKGGKFLTKKFFFKNFQEKNGMGCGGW